MTLFVEAFDKLYFNADFLKIKNKNTKKKKKLLDLMHDSMS